MKRLTVKAETRLEGAARAWINRQAADYNSGVEGVLKDLFYGGCSSGMVSELIYTRDCVKFYQKHRRDISELLKQALDDTGCGGPGELFTNPNCMEWDKSDPLAQEDGNRNLLAWFGFEEAARRLAERQGIEV